MIQAEAFGVYVLFDLEPRYCQPLESMARYEFKSNL